MELKRMKHNIRVWFIGCMSITCLLTGNVLAAETTGAPSELPMKPANFTAATVTITPQAAPPKDTAAQSNRTMASATPPQQDETAQETKIGVNLASRILTVYQGNTKTAMYSVGVGKPSTPTPVGYYSVQNKEVNPTWVDPGDPSVQIGSGPDNPLGYRWIGFNGTYGIHGTNQPASVGYYVSNGCIRMHEEDVEAVYNQVSVGTPVTVYYDRIVIDSDTDHTVSYYIYPDGYGWQNVTVQNVKNALHGYGVEDFADANSIYAKITASDGQPTYVAKAYDLIVNGEKLSKRVLKKDGVTYLPAVAVATALKMDLHWNSKQRTLTSPYGRAFGVNKSDVIYVDADDAQSLFHITGMLTPALTYVVTSLAASQPIPDTTTKVTISTTYGPENG